MEDRQSEVERDETQKILDDTHRRIMDTMRLSEELNMALMLHESSGRLQFLPTSDLLEPIGGYGPSISLCCYRTKKTLQNILLCEKRTNRME
jgi:hypothetical protein